ncbi:uncharacterized protein HMPREF1541_06489 [Cyphellophora europaea CBS 101466]|uniref:Uncharacterized protein n=1 Tax=Cyphellophora europaea (strain CBS 101466) TaxID=1220924 RepID=W2RRX2_CYPE1|nr:uncharacterized protein HMPREF1541_06489 [Cyphellophora europaea CBS 101466]ETN38454.1 hypothetical protein HMPREF1541_06489 [Cyphellophora europaea CBS 101466]
MFAARDQENLVHAHNTTAASKPLNQGIRALHPKTPGPAKTPFRRALNDENKPLTLKGQKTVHKDGPSKLDKNAFVTPAPNRAPLGMKTTNAKGNALKTPAPQQSAKPEKSIKKPSTARRSAKSKIVVAPTEPVHADVLTQEAEDDDEPEYGYAPPPIVELPDPPMEFGYNQDFPQFQGKNMFKGYGEIYCTSPTDENGMSLRKKAEEETRKQWIEEMEREASKPPPMPSLPTEEELDAQVDAMILAGPKQSRVNTVKARSAAAALSKPTASLPSAAMKETKASEQKRKPLDSVGAPSVGRRTPLAVSKGTIGFPKAKPAASIIPKADQLRQKKTAQKPKVDQSQIHPKEFVRLYGQPPEESKMWFRLKEFELLEREVEGAELADELFDTDFFTSGSNDAVDDDDDVFQLPMPE